MPLSCLMHVRSHRATLNYKPNLTLNTASELEVTDRDWWTDGIAVFTTLTLLVVNVGTVILFFGVGLYYARDKVSGVISKIRSCGNRCSTAKKAPMRVPRLSGVDASMQLEMTRRASIDVTNPMMEKTAKV